jgi:eukaryotic-like serine/threonine-protein kinase
MHGGRCRMTGVSPTRVIGGRYVVLGELGRGRSGTVWRAEDRVTGREVAVEEVHLPGRPSPDERRLIRERLLRAARAAVRVDHAGLVAMYDVVTDADVDHIVMELVEAPTLADRVATTGLLDEPAAVALARQLCAALQAVHAAEVVHGDVAPGTVVLRSDGRARLADLGVAEAVDPSRTRREPDFVAPELRDGGPATPESDLWGLGATLWFAVYGSSPPVTAGSAADAEDGELPRTVAAGPLGGVLTGLLRRAPHERWTALQVATRLDAVPARAASAGSATGAHHRWWAVAVVVGLVVGLAAGFALAGAGGPGVTTLTYGPGGDVQVRASLDSPCLRGGLEPGSVAAPPESVDCAGTHDLEVFATLDPFGPRDMPYPGHDVLARFASSACTAAFAAVVSVPTELEIVALVPSEAEFAFRSAPATRDVQCLLRAADGTALTGTRVAADTG